jgi:hypothetical protein
MCHGEQMANTKNIYNTQVMTLDLQGPEILFGHKQQHWD